MTKLQFDLRQLSSRENYFLITASVVPRPIAWISTVSKDGVPNLAPYSYFNACSTDPAIIHFTSTGVKDTLVNVQDTGEFVVNVVSHHARQAMRNSSAAFPPGEDEFEHAQVERRESVVVKAPRVADARISFECTLRDVIQMGAGTMVFGDVVMMHVDEDVWLGDRIDMERLDPVGRMSGMNYTTIRDIYRLEIPDELADYEVFGGAPELSS